MPDRYETRLDRVETKIDEGFKELRDLIHQEELKRVTTDGRMKMLALKVSMLVTGVAYAATLFAKRLIVGI